MRAPNMECQCQFRLTLQDLTLLNHLHMAMFVLIWLVTYMCTAEFLALRKKYCVPPLVLLLPRWSVEIAASEKGMSTKTGVRDGSVLMDQHASMGQQLPYHVPNTPQWSQHRSGTRFRTLQEVIKTRSVERYDKNSRLAADNHAGPNRYRKVFFEAMITN